jgi:hypothetical protein
MGHEKSIFIGLLLFVYGILILGPDIAGLGVPNPGGVLREIPRGSVVVGALMLAIGAFYTLHPVWERVPSPPARSLLPYRTPPIPGCSLPCAAHFEPCAPIRKRKGARSRAI